ncbi:hypothetical protein LTR53_017777 [Teratosphaeriaceae sp. CCFEE 6253]|nr:hypothetical protein LTR53_017777 [Teratosphaeriaceae sp. CCFEE 6253]
MELLLESPVVAGNGGEDWLETMVTSVELAGMPNDAVLEVDEVFDVGPAEELSIELLGTVDGNKTLMKDVSDELKLDEALLNGDIAPADGDCVALVGADVAVAEESVRPESTLESTESAAVELLTGTVMEAALGIGELVASP